MEVGMRVFLDEAELPEAGLTLGSALDAGRVAALAKKRVIVEVWADGERTGDDEIATPPTFEPYADELRLVSVDPAALVTTTLYDAADMMPQVQRMQSEVSQSIHRGEKAEALGRLQEVLSVWDSARRAVAHGCALLEISPDSVLGSESRFGSSVEDLGSTLKIFVEAAKGDDWVTVADTLEDEMHTLAGVWQEMLCELADAISKGRVGDE
jgi:hypothetical protein